MSKITFIDEAEIENKKILLRLDLNLSLNKNHQVSDDFRLRRSLPSIEYLLKNGNKLTIISHLGSPKGYDPQLSLSPIVELLKKFLPDYQILLGDVSTLKNQTEKQIFVIENIRFYPQEYTNDDTFAEELAKPCDIFVNDAFSVCHRTHSSIVGVPQYIPSYGGLLMKREIEILSRLLNKPTKPFVAIVGGSKIETKLNLIGHLTEIADYVLIGGALANTFLCAYGYEIGKSYCEYEKVSKARRLLFTAQQKHTAVFLPSDVILNNGKSVKIDEIPPGAKILDIGPATTTQFQDIITKAETIVWNGPLGYFEDSAFRAGTNHVFEAIINNNHALSIVGGGDTITAISKKDYLEKITHVSTGGGAMLEFIEKGTLPGLEALKR